MVAVTRHKWGRAGVGRREHWFSQDPPDSSGAIPSPLPMAYSLTLCGSDVDSCGYHISIWSHITCVGDAGTQT